MNNPGSTSAILLWAMLSQSLLTGVQRSCRTAVQRVAVYYALVGREVSSTNTGAYCRARAKVTAGVVRRLTALWSQSQLARRASLEVAHFAPKDRGMACLEA